MPNPFGDPPMVAHNGGDDQRPGLSLVVVAHDMARELPRTLISLSPGYQQDIEGDQYEVIVVDNGSTPPLDLSSAAPVPPNLRVVRIEDASPSPAHAINVGLGLARGDVVGVMVDGARLLSPGVLNLALSAAKLYPRTVVATVGWALGADSSQPKALAAGFDQAHEDELLRHIDWPGDGYRLFEISAPVPTSARGGLAPISESNALFLRRELWAELHGADERFDAPGGGFLNLDLLRRAVELPGARLVMLLGEGTFHQLHGDLGRRRDRSPATTIRGWREQYETITGRPWKVPVPASPPTYLGTLPTEALSHLVRSSLEAVPGPGHPLGNGFDRELWIAGKPSVPADPRVRRLVRLAHAELRAGRFAATAAVARLARTLAPIDPEVMRLLRYTSNALRPTGLTPAESAAVHEALGRARSELGERKAAALEYEAALKLDPDRARAHWGSSQLRFPGEEYVAWLRRFHELLKPRTYLEIGVAEGKTLAMAKPPTVAIGIDPSARIAHPITAQTHMFAALSDDFFQAGHLARLLDAPVDLGFIDGAHHFDQVLRDFINLEKHCHPGSVILFHDTVPLDEVTQRRERETKFWSGDVWKAIVCIREYRPDLEVFTIGTPPTGLTVITRLDPASRVLEAAYKDAVERFAALPYDTVAAGMHEMLNVVPNDAQAVMGRIERARATSGPAAPTNGTGPSSAHGLPHALLPGPGGRTGRNAASPGRVLLHVGTHKTGTTAFQRYLVEWRADLLLEHGILVHRGCFMPSHFEVPALVIRDELLTPDRWLLRGRRFQMDTDSMRRAIRRTVEADADTVMFSAEGLSYLRTSEEVERLRRLLWPRQIVPIVALREKEHFLSALGDSLSRMGFSGPSAERASVAYTQSDSWLGDYDALIGALEELAGPGPVHVIDYDREMGSTGSIIPALAEKMGVPREALYPGWDRRDNVTPVVATAP